MASFPQNYLDLADQKVAFASLATLMPDGTPQVTPVWFDYTNGLIRVNTATGRVKANNMREGAAVALSILDPDNPYRYVQIRGKVTHTTRDGGRCAYRRAVAQIYGKGLPVPQTGRRPHPGGNHHRSRFGQRLKF